jgi:hypothetical protein
MAKKKADETSEIPEAPKLKKSDAMREAIKRGIDKPQDASEFIKKEFGLDVAPQVFSSFKSISKKKGAGSTVESMASTVFAAAPKANGHHVNIGGAIELAKQLKGLVTQYGADEVSGMLAVLRD